MREKGRHSVFTKRSRFSTLTLIRARSSQATKGTEMERRWGVRNGSEARERRHLMAQELDLNTTAEVVVVTATVV